MEDQSRWSGIDKGGGGSQGETRCERAVGVPRFVRSFSFLSTLLESLEVAHENSREMKRRGRFMVATSSTTQREEQS